MSQVLEVAWSWKNELLTVQHAANVEQLTLRPHANPSPASFLRVRMRCAELPVPLGSPVAMQGLRHVVEDAAPLTVRRGETARLVWHGLVADIRWVEAQPALRTRSVGVDALWTQVTTGVGGLVALMAGVMMVAPAENQDVEVKETLARVTRQVATRVSPPPKPAPSGGARPRPAGRVGLQHARVTQAARPKGRSVDPVSRAALLQQVRGMGVMAMLTRKGGALDKVMSSDLGGDVENSLGLLRNGPLDAAAGAGGWASRGHGDGGGNNVVGLGELGDGTRTGPPGTADAPMLRRHPPVTPLRPGCTDCNVVGGLTRDEIARVMRRYLSQVRYCYEKQLNGNPNLAGKVVVSFVIGGTGRVDSADVAESSLQHDPTETCITNIIRRITFPQPRGGGTVLVNHPFVFQSAGN